MSNKTTGASDTLTLTDEQQQSIWNDVSRHATNQTAPADFNVAVGPKYRPSSIPIRCRAGRRVTCRPCGRTATP